MYSAEQNFHTYITGKGALEEQLKKVFSGGETKIYTK